MVHDNLCKLIDYQLDRRAGTAHLLMEVSMLLENFLRRTRLNVHEQLCEGGCLFDEIKRLQIDDARMPTATMWSYLVQIVNGLHFMHGKERPPSSEIPGTLVHGDLKPINSEWNENVPSIAFLITISLLLVLFADSDRKKIKIADFGLVKHLGEKKCVDGDGSGVSRARMKSCSPCTDILTSDMVVHVPRDDPWGAFQRQGGYLCARSHPL